MAAADMNVVAPRRTVLQSLTGTWRYRELLVNLVRKELKVRYKNSSLGFLWSMLNPLMYLVVFYVVFQLVLKAGVPYFPVFLLSGLLGWNLFSASLAAATGSITGNASLVNKVWFPREILPLASIGANSVHFLLQGFVLCLGLVVFRFDVDLGYVWLVLPALVTLLLFTAAMCIFLSAANVYARDTQHFLELVLLAWQWLTPMIYPWALQANELAGRGQSAMLTLLNPMSSIVLALQRALYGIETADDGTRILPVESSLWYLRNLGIVAAISVVLLLLAIRLFTKVEGDFAEEL
ncbi:MAG TPA: ABC transporter permease [Acidimicrobiales bacterium]|nr:ABC transporter permease [Acidimicrobiales bacterium]